MKETLAAFGPTATLIQGHDGSREMILTLLCKRTYRLDPGGRLALAADQVPLFEEPVIDHDRPGPLFLHDSDLYPWKPLTDVIVNGHAYAPAPAPTFNAGVLVGTHAKHLAVIGNRRATLSSTGKILFSAAEPVAKMPVSSDFAYGGLDAVAEATLGDPAAALKACLPPEHRRRASLYLYPRNFAGRGYLIAATAEAVEACELPNLEDPADRLTPDRLAVGNVDRWPSMPLPWSLGVLDFGCFPRVGYAGVVPNHEPGLGIFAEITRGFASASIINPVYVSPDDRMDTRFTSSGSLGLQLPELRGNEPVVLHNLHRAHEKLSFALPGERPRLSLPTSGGIERADATLATVTIEPDEDRVTLVWRGTTRAKRAYLPDELAQMAFLVEW